MEFDDLKTQRLLLHGISADDRDFIFRLFSNIEVNRYLFDAEPVIDLAGADEIVTDYTTRNAGDCHRWVLVRKDDGAPIGTCGFHCWDQAAGSAEIGYDLLPSAQGSGYMAEAVNAMLGYLHGDLGISRVTACIYPENVKSGSLVKRLGFVWGGKTRNEIYLGVTYPHQLYVLDVPGGQDA
ncbi:GNAT family N-acetyltransferase [Glycomyces luteolus]|uniref:GNAT family N-acetyltransferase n=1 Tax=Glycomyces luteolus TaxID=2670330 RepID=A0A9X3P7J3_9ACTN|nr:GNAT family N-acetyltransferase [Glycomyces luteolus]MDA1359722.1 GNAT family N-acetyltransferase [Glycomyces luteolus]MDA1359727.1 GNAT family N-acetyltransferase [Glycomyces luteolus]